MVVWNIQYLGWSMVERFTKKDSVGLEWRAQGELICQCCSRDFDLDPPTGAFWKLLKT